LTEACREWQSDDEGEGFVEAAGVEAAAVLECAFFLACRAIAYGQSPPWIG